MRQEQATLIEQIVHDHGADRTRLMDVARAVNRLFGYVPHDAIPIMATCLGMTPVEVRDAVSFYGHFSMTPQGRSVVRLCNAVVERMMGADDVAAAFEHECGTKFGTTTNDGAISLSYTPCIGLSDQAPNALIDGIAFTNLHAEDVPSIVSGLRAGKDLSDHPKAQVVHNLEQPGPIIFQCMDTGDSGLERLLELTPDEVISEIKESGMRGAGGAGFPAAIKWQTCRDAPGEKHYVICNADEGEPGTFKDRILLARNAHQVFEGMTVAAYAAGATEGIVYLRGEYEYLYDQLEAVLQHRRDAGQLGTAILGHTGFDFDIRIQLGAGSYIVGEEFALIESLEGRRAAPRERPPFPVEHGYHNQPTLVSNVETFASAASVIHCGPQWFSSFGTEKSKGTKLLSISGDVGRPGVYEIEYGTTIEEILSLVEARDTQAVQIGGASGKCVSPRDFSRKIAFEDIPTGGSFIVFDNTRDVLEYMRQFSHFFAEESCGWCAPCRIGTTILAEFMDRLVAGGVSRAELEQIKQTCATISGSSRCGLGVTAPRPLVTSLESLPELYEKRLKDEPDTPHFDMHEAIRRGAQAAGRPVPEEVHE